MPTRSNSTGQSPRRLNSPVASIERLSGRLSRSTRRGTHKRTRSRSATGFGEDGTDEWNKSASDRDRAIADMREALKKQGYQQEFDGSTLLRFLRAREYDVQKATTMYVNHLKWRKENGIDTILEDFDFKEREQYLAVYPQGYYNVDKEGRPVTIQHLGQVNPKRINQVTTEERMIKYHVQEYERFLKKMAPTCSQLQGRHIDSSTAILDVKGVGLGVMTGDVRKVLNRIMSISQDHYPETMFQTIIINAPASFRMVWSIVKGMLQPRTVNKITLLGSKYLDDLTQRVELKHLPTYLGGECAATLLEDPGPWNDETIMTNLRGIREMPSFNGASALPPASAELGRYSSVESDKDGADDFKMAENGQRGSASSPRVAAHKGPTAAPSHAAGDVGASGASQTFSESASGTLLERIKALEARMREQRGCRYDGHAQLPGTAPTSLLARVQLLETSMARLLEAQEANISRRGSARLEGDDDIERTRGCCACCCVM